MYNGRSHQKWVITEVTPPDVFGSGSRPHPGKAGLQATTYAVVALADDSGSYSRLILGLRLPLPHLPNTAKEAAPYAMYTLTER